MSELLDKIHAASTYLRKKGINEAAIGVVLGTGLGSSFINKMEAPLSIDYEAIPHFPISTVEFHHGQLIYGKIAGKTVIAMRGRFHLYEGYTYDQVTFPIKVFKQLGIKLLLISNAAGNLNTSWQKGELMLIDDHINLQPGNPLAGPNEAALGPRFPDMSEPYKQHIIKELEVIAASHNILLRKGVYVAVTGPSLETRAEYRFLRQIGADAVGMSTVPEVIIAHHMGIPCAAISVLTDDCDPDQLQVADITEILEIAAKCEPHVTKLFTELIKSFELS